MTDAPMSTLTMFRLQMQLRVDAHLGQTPFDARDCEHCNDLDDALNT